MKYQKCPLASVCGGCRLMDLPYAVQLDEKQEYVEQWLDRFCSVAPIIGMEDPTHYRAKIQAVFGIDGRKGLVSGIYREGSHRIVPIRDCLVEDTCAAPILATIRNLMKRFSIAPYDEDRGHGYIRHVLIRKARATGEVMVVLIVGHWPIPNRQQFLDILKQRHPEISTIVLNHNDEKTSMVLGDGPDRILFGNGYVVEQIGTLSFRISAKSFFQINPVQAKVLYAIAMKMARLKKTDRVIDAYCGTGTIALFAAKEGVASVVGLESNEEAVHDAQLNAEANGLENVSFLQTDASRHLKEMAKNGELCDVLFLDPPRSGSDERFLAAALKMEPERIVYISCNVETLERDIRYLLRFSDAYRVRGIQPVDMFPHTAHVETVVLLSRIDW